MKNKRVQIQYYKKLPENTKKVSRPSRWGNPFKLKQHGGEYTLESSLAKYQSWLDIQLEKNIDFLRPLYGYDLGCFCPLDSPCHADILLSFIHELDR